MGLFDKLRNLFLNDRLPGEDRKAYQQARDIPSLLRKLQDNITANEVELRKIKGDIAKLDMTEKATISSIKRGNIKGRAVKGALHTVNRYRKQLEILEQKTDILNRNLNLNLNLRGKIELMEAMELKGIDQNLIDAMIIEFGDNMDRYQEGVMTGESVVENAAVDLMPDAEREELAALEAEILGEVKHFGSSRSASSRSKNAVVDEDELPSDEAIMKALDESDQILREMGSLEGEESKGLLEE